MDKAEFDRFAEEYRALHAKNIAASGETPDFFAEYKIRDIAEELKRRSLTANNVLDFGSGVGNSFPWAKRYLPTAKVIGLDVSERSLEVSEKRFPGMASLIHFDGETLPIESETIDVAYAMCVFHHIDEREHIRLLKELRRVLTPNGMLAIFEHNPYNPLTVRAVNTCEFDINAKLITAAAMKQECIAAGFDRTDVRYRIFFPHALAGLRGLEKYMVSLPFGAQYSVFASKA